MQVERLTYQFAVMPETKALLSDAQRVSLVGSASDQLVRTLPEVIAREREALIAQLVRTINDDNATIGSLAAQLRTTLQAGTETANAVHGTLDVFERIKAQFGPKPGEAVPQDNGPPFDIRQYTEMLREATNTSRELNTLAQRADSLLPVLRTATQDASGQLDKVLNRLFLLLLLLILAAAAAALLAALAYRRLSARFNRGSVSARS
jgi:small-conductance mechanosensitive channel